MKFQSRLAAQCQVDRFAQPPNFDPAPPRIAIASVLTVACSLAARCLLDVEIKLDTYSVNRSSFSSLSRLLFDNNRKEISTHSAIMALALPADVQKVANEGSVKLFGKWDSNE
jgi:hypothetical protein